MRPNKDNEDECEIKNIAQITAAPYKKSNYEDTEERENNTNEGEVIEASTSNYSVEDEFRISTRARLTYELDRYSKNAMLIFEGNSTEVTTETHEIQNNDDICAKLKETFEKFRFEVEIFRDLKDEEIASICDTFFQRDFTEYGCVGVMMLAKTRDGIVESSHTPNSEFGVLRYLSDLFPPTLQGKPKIYMVQTEACYVVPRARLSPRLPQDTIEFRMPVPIAAAIDAQGKRSNMCSLLEHIYKKIDTTGHKTDLYTILYDSVYNFTRSWQLFDLPVGFYSSLTKELRLARTSEL